MNPPRHEDGRIVLGANCGSKATQHGIKARGNENVMANLIGADVNRMRATVAVKKLIVSTGAKTQVSDSAADGAVVAADAGIDIGKRTYRCAMVAGDGTQGPEVKGSEKGEEPKARFRLQKLSLLLLLSALL